MAKKSYLKADEIQIKGNKIFSPVRRKWIPLTPEERVRQEYLFVLTEEYGYTIDQISEEMDVSSPPVSPASNGPGTFWRRQRCLKTGFSK